MQRSLQNDEQSMRNAAEYDRLKTQEVYYTVKNKIQVTFLYNRLTAS